MVNSGADIRSRILEVMLEFDREATLDSVARANAAGASLQAFPKHLDDVEIPVSLYGPTKKLVVPGGKLENFVTISNITVRDYVAPFLVALLFEAAADPRIGAVGSASSYRSAEKQKERYEAWVRRDPGANEAAPPGRSKHEYGLAIDFHIDGRGSAGGNDFPAMIAFAELALRFSFKRTVTTEPWHFAFLGEPITPHKVPMSLVAATTLLSLVELLGDVDDHLRKEIVKDYYDQLRAVSRTRALVSANRGDYYLAHGRNLEEANEALQKRSSLLRSAVASIDPDTVTAQEVFSGWAYDFNTGLWTDGATGGRII